LSKNKDINYIWTDKKRTFLGLPLSFTRYYLTETKLIVRTGFFNITEDEVELYKITDKKLLRPFGQRLCGCGTIIIYSKDVSAPELEIHSVKKVRNVLNMIDENLNKVRDKYGIRGRDLMGLSNSHNTDDYDESHTDDNDI